MTSQVNIQFDCLPLRCVGRFDVPVDASEDEVARYERLRQAVLKHGTFNTYYLYKGVCVFHLTNHAEIGMVEYRFEGVALTDARDERTLSVDLEVELSAEVCEWLTSAASKWLGETVRHAVKAEFDRYIAAGDLQKAIERVERLQAESDARGGFLGMGL